MIAALVKVAGAIKKAAEASKVAKAAGAVAKAAKAAGQAGGKAAKAAGQTGGSPAAAAPTGFGQTIANYAKQAVQNSGPGQAVEAVAGKLQPGQTRGGKIGYQLASFLTDGSSGKRLGKMDEPAPASPDSYPGQGPAASPGPAQPQSFRTFADYLEESFHA